MTFKNQMLYNKDSRTGEIMEEYNKDELKEEIDELEDQVHKLRGLILDVGHNEIDLLSLLRQSGTELCLSELLEIMNRNKDEYNAIVQEMAQKRRDYEASLVPLKQRLGMISGELSQLGCRTVSVKLGDLLDEICWLSETNVEDIDVSLTSNVSLDGVYDMNEFLRFVGNSKNYSMKFSLSNNGKDSNKQYMFNFLTNLSMDFDSIQADGKTLLEHCSTCISKRLNRMQYTELVVDKDIDNIILEFNLNYLNLDTCAMWRPADLFTQAVINCIDRKNNARTAKIRQRIKDGK